MKKWIAVILSLCMLLGLLRIYEPFHDSLLAYAEAGMDGCIRHETREDWKSMVQMRMLQAIWTRWRSLL